MCAGVPGAGRAEHVTAPRARGRVLPDRGALGRLPPQRAAQHQQEAQVTLSIYKIYI